MNFLKLLVCVFLIHQGNGCSEFRTCGLCTRQSCRYTTFVNKTRICAAGSFYGKDVIFTAKKDRHCRSLVQITKGWISEPSSSASVSIRVNGSSTATNVSLTIIPPTALVPTTTTTLLPTFTPTTTRFPTFPTTTTFLPTTTTPLPTTTTPLPTTTTRLSTTATPLPTTTTTISVTTTPSPTTTVTPKQSSPAEPYREPIDVITTHTANSRFDVVNRNGNAVLVSKRPKKAQHAPCSPVIFSDTGLFPTASKLMQCDKEMFETPQDMYLRTLCVINDLSRRISKEGFLELDRLYFSQNPAKEFKLTCMALKYRKQKCIKGKLRIPKILESVGKRRMSGLFVNITSSTACNTKTESLNEAMVRHVCPLRRISTMFVVDKLSYYEHIFQLINPSFGYEAECSAVLLRRNKCYNKN